MADKKYDAFIIRLQPQVADALREMLDRTTGMSISEALQACAIFLYKSASCRMSPTKEMTNEINDALERFLLSAVNTEAFHSYRHILGVQEYAPHAGRVERLIILHPGNVVSVFNPHDPDYIGGSIVLGKDEALKILMSEDGHLPAKLSAIMQDRGTQSVERVMEELIDEEYRLMQLQSQRPQYAQNEYGQTYKKIPGNGMARKDI